MKILFIGDIVGSPGRHAVATLVPRLRQERGLDMVIANGENSAHGAGLTEATVGALLGSGVDVITTGDHVWDQKGFEKFIELEPRVVRPLNYPAGTPGRGSSVVNGVAVINLVGRVFMPPCDCPFRAVQAEVARLRQQTNLIVLDIHAEATSEKMAMGWFLDGQVSAVLGTHTHVPTADGQILPKGTAFITDVGMTGPHDSVLGRDKQAVIRRFVTQMPQKLEVADGNVLLNGVILDVDDSTGLARSIERIRA
ncbi:MAG: TIGR00282 family metallophosphoesterase [Verrucomicrobia bacterium]|nr:TIGR00282 family metallophosphoesterase [Verrucomicrobiota bacterium]